MSETLFHKENSNLSNNQGSLGRGFLDKDDSSSAKRITKQFLRNLLRSDIKLYYCTPNLNDTLYLHYKGFEAIENLEEFSDLKVLYLEGNCISKIENLSNKAQLRCLYLQENMIKKIENLEFLESLVHLNLSDNFIETIEGLDKNFELETLQLKRNKIGVNGLTDVEHLRKLKKVSSLDISNNFIDCENFEDFIAILESMESIAVLYLQNNLICKRIPNYRKTLIARLKNLKYLDDRPVFPEERRFSEAFYFHGIEAEREERRKHKQEEEERHLRQHQAFKERFLGSNNYWETGIMTEQQADQHANDIETRSQPEIDSVNDSGFAANDHTLSSSKLETYYTNEEGESKKTAHNSEVAVDDSSHQKSLDDSLSVNDLVDETKSLNLNALEELD